MEPNKQVQDITINQAKPAETTAQNSGLQVELEHNIPIKQPNQPALQAVTPIAPAKQFIEGDNKSDKDLEGALKDASREVKNLAKAPAKKPRFDLKRLLPKKQPKQNESATRASSKRPILIIAAAFIIGAGLVVAAVYAFRSQPTQTKTSAAPSTVGTSSTSSDAIQAAGGSLIKPGDISDFSASLQSKIDQLNDTQDFSSKDLADQTLGL